MTQLKRTTFAASTAARTAALTASWKKAFDGPIREAALTRELPKRARGKLALAGLSKTRQDSDPRP